MVVPSDYAAHSTRAGFADFGHMRVALLNETYSRKTGYLPNTIPKYMARAGVEVHVVATDLPPYYQLSDFHSTYGGFTDTGELPAGAVESIDGVTVHILPHKRFFGYMRMANLRAKLAEIRPDIVQVTTAIGWIPLEAAALKPLFGYELFTGSHTTASVFPLATHAHHIWNRRRLRSIATRAIPGFAVSLLTRKCYAATVDCADVARRFFGVQKNKIDVCPLGVDTDRFYDSANHHQQQQRAEFRQRFGFSDEDIVCVYSGRFTPDKNPALLARAIERLRDQGETYRGLFIGNGEQASEIASRRGCVLHPFVQVHELAAYFHSADVGVWPTQESMSMLDAAACGLPIVVNDTMRARERIDNNGLTYRLNDCDDLERVLLLLRSAELRRSLGAHGAEKMRREFSWDTIARRRLRDYQLALNARVSS
jgi:glycosyltransferase involved in cell wall biosynthesis